MFAVLVLCFTALFTCYRDHAWRYFKPSCKVLSLSPCPSVRCVTPHHPQPAENAPSTAPQRPAGEEIVRAVSTTTTLDRNSLNSNPPPVSPYAVKPVTSLVKPNSQGKLPPPIANKPATLRRPAPGIHVNGKGTFQTQGEVRSAINYLMIIFWLSLLNLHWIIDLENITTYLLLYL